MFCQKDIEYLSMDQEFILVRGINEAPIPINITQLTAFVGLMNYYGTACCSYGPTVYATGEGS